MNKRIQLITDVTRTRAHRLAVLEAATVADAQGKPADDGWNLVDNTGQLVSTEQGVPYGMWKTLYAIRNGTMKRRFESPHKDRPIERLIEHTWKEKERALAVAVPRPGGTLVFWRFSLANLQAVPEAFRSELQDDESRLPANPTAISGAMDFQHCIAFLRFYSQRHTAQVQNTLAKIRTTA